MLAPLLFYIMVFFTGGLLSTPYKNVSKRPQGSRQLSREPTLEQKAYLSVAQSTAWREYLKYVVLSKTEKREEMYGPELYTYINRAALCDAASDILYLGNYPLKNKRNEVLTRGSSYTGAYLFFTMILNKHFFDCIDVTGTEIYIKKNVSPEILQKHIAAFSAELEKWFLAPLPPSKKYEKKEYWVVRESTEVLRKKLLFIVSSDKQDSVVKKAVRSVVSPKESIQKVSAYLSSILHSPEMHKIVKRFQFSLIDLTNEELQELLPQKPKVPVCEPVSPVSSGHATPFSRAESFSSFNTMEQVVPENFYTNAQIKSINIGDSMSESNTAYNAFIDSAAPNKTKKKGFFRKYKNIFKKKRDTDYSTPALLPSTEVTEVNAGSSAKPSPAPSIASFTHLFSDSASEHVDNEKKEEGSSLKNNQEISIQTQNRMDAKKEEASHKDLLAYEIDALSSKSEDSALSFNKDLGYEDVQEFSPFYYESRAPASACHTYATQTKYVSSPAYPYAEEVDFPHCVQPNLNKFSSLTSFHIVQQVDSNMDKKVRRHASSEALLYSERAWKSDDSTGMYDEYYALVGHPHAAQNCTHSDSFIAVRRPH